MFHSFASRNLWTLGGVCSNKSNSRNDLRPNIGIGWRSTTINLHVSCLIPIVHIYHHQPSARCSSRCVGTCALVRYTIGLVAHCFSSLLEIAFSCAPVLRLTANSSPFRLTCSIKVGPSLRLATVGTYNDAARSSSRSSCTCGCLAWWNSCVAYSPERTDSSYCNWSTISQIMNSCVLGATLHIVNDLFRRLFCWVPLVEVFSRLPVAVAVRSGVGCVAPHCADHVVVLSLHDLRVNH